MVVCAQSQMMQTDRLLNLRRKCVKFSVRKPAVVNWSFKKNKIFLFFHKKSLLTQTFN